MGQEDVRRDLKELRDQVQALQDALMRVMEPYADLAASLGQLQDLARGYLRLLDLYARQGSISPDAVIPSLKDDIARHIVAALVDRPDRNISQIADAVKARRGTASRRIVRERLEDLETRGIVVAIRESRGRTFRVSEDVMRKWSQVLGFPKYEDRPGKVPSPRGGIDVEGK